MKGYRIAMVAACPFPANYGSAASILEMSQVLAERGHEVHVVTYHVGLSTEGLNFTVHRIPYVPTYRKRTSGPAYQKPLLDGLLALKLIQVVRRERIDLIHAHNYEATLAAYIARRFTGRPVIYNAVTAMGHELPMHNFIRPKSLAVKVGNWLDAYVPTHADFITAVSPDLVALAQRQGVPAERIALIPAGVNLSDFENPDPTKIRREFRLGDRPVVLYTGILDPFQGIENLLAAMKLVLQEIPEAVLLIVANSAFHRFERMARELGIHDSVIFANDPPFCDIKHYLAASQVTVVPRVECPGFPVKLLNYMAGGKASVAFAGSAKCIEHLKTGWVVPGGDIADFARGIIALLRDPALAEQLGRRAREHLKGNYEWHALAERIEQVYAKVMAQGESVPATAKPSAVRPVGD
ncbi:MAG: glycosyltransferase family 4 protein [Abditibacteriales bacterium]|nr:glycosyltransferase family 4 protein [Abditibacteriales bacterium]MDW8364588.1 glycosyltransferase family 4 protein [Abditibacteriales bacterium]